MFTAHSRNHKPAKDAIAIMTTPIRSVAVAMLMAAGFVSATKTIKTPRRIRITAERKTALLVSRLILFSNGTQVVELCPYWARLGPPGAAEGRPANRAVKNELHP